MAGIELRARDGRALGVEVCDRVRAHGVILRPLGDVVVWMPPLSVSPDDLALLERATWQAIDEATDERLLRHGHGYRRRQDPRHPALARCARDLGKKVFAFKPVETGCEAVDGRAGRPGPGGAVPGRRGAGSRANSSAGRASCARRSRRSWRPRWKTTSRSTSTGSADAEDGAARPTSSLVEGAGGEWRVPLITAAHGRRTTSRASRGCRS